MNTVKVQATPRISEKTLRLLLTFISRKLSVTSLKNKYLLVLLGIKIMLFLLVDYKEGIIDIVLDLE